MSLSEDWSAEIAIPRSDPRWVAELSESSNYPILIKFSYWVTCDRLEQTCAKFHGRSLKTVAVSTKKCTSLSEDWYCESMLIFARFRKFGFWSQNNVFCQLSTQKSLQEILHELSAHRLHRGSASNQTRSIGVSNSTHRQLNPK